jgi:hypothetical protein
MRSLLIRLFLSLAITQIAWGATMPGKVEIVMCPGSTLRASQADETITITATALTERRYEINGMALNLDLVHRNERWNGSLGLYAPSGDKNVHAVTEEGFQYFYSQREFFQWLSGHNNRLHYIYTSNGLVLGWNFQDRPKGVNTGPEKALSVELWQIFIGDKRPTTLPGASDRKALLLAGNGNCAVVPGYSASAPQTIDGRIFSGRSIDAMRDRGFTPTQIGKFLANARATKASGGQVFYNITGDGPITLIEIDNDDRVIRIE